MMQTELLEEIIQLPIPERIEIIEKISQSVRKDLQNGQESQISAERRHEAYLRLKGAASVPGKIPPTDEEIKEDYTNYLIEKYK
jgi:hypothetical protein